MSPTPKTRCFTARPTAGKSHNWIRPYWIVEPNREMPTPNNGVVKNGLYTVTPAWRGSILYGTTSRFSVTNILFSAGWSEYWVGDPGFEATIHIGPPNAAEGPYRQATAVPQFGFPDPYNEDWYKLVSVTLQDGGEGYASAPNVSISYSPPPRPAHQFGIRAEIGANGCNMDTPDHGLKAGDQISYRWLWHNEDLTRAIPPQIYWHCRSIVQTVNGAAVTWSGGFPQPGMPTTAEDYYIPGDLCDGHSPDSGFGSATVGPSWATPGYFDPKHYNPYVNAPPYRLSIYKHDPEPVHFYQDRDGGALRIGDLVAVHEHVRMDGKGSLLMPDLPKGQLVVPALKARMGDWNYYVTFLQFRDVAERISAAEEIHSASALRELLQRGLRSRAPEIAQYLATQPQRFFNSLVVGTYGGAPQWHEVGVQRLPSSTIDVPAYAEGALGFLVLSGSETLFAIDGQHRVAGIRKAIEDKTALATEEVSVIFLRGVSASKRKDDEDGFQRTPGQRRSPRWSRRYSRPTSSRSWRSGI